MQDKAYFEKKWHFVFDFWEFLKKKVAFLPHFQKGSVWKMDAPFA